MNTKKTPQVNKHLNSSARKKRANKVRKARMFMRARHSVFRWTRAFWAVGLSVGVGALVFRDTIAASIASTPHPELVFVIFAAAIAAVGLSGWTLWHYLREEWLARKLRRLPRAEQLAVLERKTWASDFDALYELLLRPMTVPMQVMEQKVETEIFAGEERLFARLSLAAYLGNSLVGIGLVGTFIGLLQSLADLGALFASLMNAGGANSDPVAMFSDMLRRLQEPMKGMGTAFVASLYGVMGSLVMGLVIYGVRRSGEQAIGWIRRLVRKMSVSWYDAPVQWQAANSSVGSESTENTLALRDLSHALGARAQLERDFLHQQAALFEAVGMLDRQVHERSQRLIGSLEQVLKAQHLAHRQMLAQGRRERRWTRVAWLVQALVLAVVVGLGGLLWGFAQQVGALKDTLVFGVTPVAATVQAPSAVPAAPAEDTLVWTVRRGDSLWSIAQRHGISLADLLLANPSLKSADSVLLEGTEVVVPNRVPRD